MCDAREYQRQTSPQASNSVIHYTVLCRRCDEQQMENLAVDVCPCVNFILSILSASQPYTTHILLEKLFPSNSVRYMHQKWGMTVSDVSHGADAPLTVVCIKERQIIHTLRLHAYHGYVLNPSHVTYSFSAKALPSHLSCLIIDANMNARLFGCISPYGHSQCT